MDENGSRRNESQGLIRKDSVKLSERRINETKRRVGVTDGTRTRNNQNHNLELYH